MLSQEIVDGKLPDATGALTVLAPDASMLVSGHLGLLPCRLEAAHVLLRNMLDGHSAGGAAAAELLQNFGEEAFSKLMSRFGDDLSLRQAAVSWCRVVAPSDQEAVRAWAWTLALTLPESGSALSGDGLKSEAAAPLIRAFAQCISKSRNDIDEWVWSKCLSKWDSDFADGLGGRQMLSSILMSAAANWQVCCLSRELSKLEDTATRPWLIRLARDAVGPHGLDTGLLVWPPMPVAVQEEQSAALSRADQ